MSLPELLDEMLRLDATELHLAVEQPHTYRVEGILIKGDKMLGPDDAREVLIGALADVQQRQFADRGFVDSTINHKARRFIIHIASAGGHPSGSVFLLPSDVRPLEELVGDPDDLSKLYQVTQFRKGVVIVTGPIGSGKVSLCASMIETINRLQAKRIITIENPINADFASKKSVITQHMIGFDFASVAQAIESAAASRPEIVYISEIRDFEAFEAAFALAESGCLVLTTYSQPSAAAAVKQLNDAFPGHRERTRELLTTGLQGIVATQLVPTLSGKEKVGAYEVLVGTVRVRGIIQEGKWDFMNVMREGRNLGMQPMDDSLLRHFKAHKISYDEARHRMLAKDLLPSPAKP